MVSFADKDVEMNKMDLNDQHYNNEHFWQKK